MSKTIILIDLLPLTLFFPFFAGVLEEDEDVLLNVNIADDEKAAKNVELKKGKPGYNPYEEEEVDEFGNVRKLISCVQCSIAK